MERTSWNPASSASTFCANCVVSVASRSTIVGVALLRFRREPRPGAHEVEVHAFEQSLLLRVEPERVAPRVERVDAGEERGVHVGRAVVRGLQRRDGPLDRLQLGRGLGRGEVAEQRVDSGQQRAGAIEGRQRVVEVRRIRIRGDRVELVAMGLPGGVECRPEMRRLQRRERRQAVRRVPRLEQRVGLGGAGGCRLRRSGRGGGDALDMVGGSWKCDGWSAVGRVRRTPRCGRRRARAVSRPARGAAARAAPSPARRCLPRGR